jgi:hypothetical protein
MDDREHNRRVDDARRHEARIRELERVYEDGWITRSEFEELAARLRRERGRRARRAA